MWIRKWCIIREKLKNETSECPVIDTMIVTSLKYELRTQVLRRTAKCLGFLSCRGYWLAESKVHDLEITMLIDHQVLRFQISIHVTLFVDVSESRNDLSSIDTCSCFTESSDGCSLELSGLVQKTPQLTTLADF